MSRRDGATLRTEPGPPSPKPPATRSPPARTLGGYWDVLLMHLNAAAASKGSLSSARAAMISVPTIEHELTTELKEHRPITDALHGAGTGQRTRA